MGLPAERSHRRPSPAQDLAHEVTRSVGLARDEDHELAARIAAGDREARNRMVQANLGLVVSIARKYLRHGLPLDDLVGEGNLGLIRAVKEFDPRFGTRFSSYAAYWIREAIQRALVNTASTIRLPAHMVKLLTKWRRAEQTLRHQKKRSPDFEEVARFLGLSETQRSHVIEARRALRLTWGSGSDDDAGDRLSQASWDNRNPMEEPLDADERDTLQRGLERLDVRERTVLALRYGLGGEVLPLREIGRRLGLSGEGVRKIERVSLRKLGRTRAHPVEDYQIGLHQSENGSSL